MGACESSYAGAQAKEQNIGTKAHKAFQSFSQGFFGGRPEPVKELKQIPHRALDLIKSLTVKEYLKALQDKVADMYFDEANPLRDFGVVCRRDALLLEFRQTSKIADETFPKGENVFEDACLLNIRERNKDDFEILETEFDELMTDEMDPSTCVESSFNLEAIDDFEGKLKHMLLDCYRLKHLQQFLHKCRNVSSQTDDLLPKIQKMEQKLLKVVDALFQKVCYASDDPRSQFVIDNDKIIHVGSSYLKRNMPTRNYRRMHPHEEQNKLNKYVQSKLDEGRVREVNRRLLDGESHVHAHLLV